ncbi:MAG TPA: NAD-dependent epimerase/dehydratase family protein [Chloroflexota bacterium]|nr:NAD-dependent epimerase/dehydratase family protein [Chloroflexota bacterium]
MKTLVTGASGFVGSAIATALRERGDEVRGLVRDASRARGLRERGVELAHGDMTDADSLRWAVRGVECIYHTAAVVGDWPDRGETWRVNVEGTRRLLEAAEAAGVRRVVHVSSLAVYGNRHHHGTDESAPYRYGDTYTDAKIESERVVFEWSARGAMEAVCLRPGFVYGPGDRMLLPKLMTALAEGKFVFIGDGSKQMNCIYIDDLARAAVAAGSTPGISGEALNLPDGTQTTLREFITFIADWLGVEIPSRRVPPAVAIAGCYGAEHVGRLLRVKRAPLMNISRLRFLYYNQHYSIDKARRTLGYAPEVAYRTGLPRTLEWFRSEGLLPQPLPTTRRALATAGS